MILLPIFCKNGLHKSPTSLAASPVLPVRQAFALYWISL